VTRRDLRGTLAVAAAACGWGTWALFLRGHGLPPAWQSVLILSVIALASLPAALLRRGPRRPLAIWGLLLLAALTECGNYLFYFSALDRGPIAVAVLTHYLAPVVVAAFAPLLLREPLGRRTPWALLASLAGLSLLVLGQVFGAGGAAGPAALLGAASALFYGAASALFYGANTLVSKKLLGPLADAELLSYHCALSALLLAAFAPYPPPGLRAFLWLPLAGALLVGAAGGALYYAGLRVIPAQRASVLTYLEPLVAAVVGALVFGERLGAAGLLGAALILGGGVFIVLAPVEDTENKTLK
jgi:DME family drug/metabolite transporter